MKAIVPFVLTAIAALAAAAVAGASTPAHTASASPCTPTITTAGGHTVVDYCGPATATLKVGGKTYSFKNGFCRTDIKNKIDLQLTLGMIENVKSPVNGGQTLFQMTDLNLGSLKLVTINADVGGKALQTTGGAVLKGSIPSGGTFATASSVKPGFSGSWDCHGVVVAQS